MIAFSFTKMHGLGNDMVIINTLDQSINIEKLPISLLSHRRLGIGFDQLLLLGESSQADFSCRIFNADGSEAEQCGNGMRCLARYIREKKISEREVLTIETKAGIISTHINNKNNDDHIQVTMGVPCFESSSLHDQDILIQETGLSKQELTILSVLSMGNPHLIIQVPSLQADFIHEMGPKLSTHSLFPQGINIGFMEIMNPKHIKLRTYERGAGETPACGSNACAAVAAGIINHQLETAVTVELLFGNLLIEWPEKSSPVLMTGPAVYVFDGKIEL